MNRLLATALLPFLLAKSDAFLQKPHASYPQHWWTPAARDGAPVWEILPQEARPGEVILSKRNELGLLSKFRGDAVYVPRPALGLR